MGLDLTLFSISSQAKFVLEKAKTNSDYANDFDKIQDTENLKLHLKMVQANPDGTPEYVLQELIRDSKIVLSHYPDTKIDKYRFHFGGYGYETLNYLLVEFLKEKHLNIGKGKIFYDGIDICNTQLIRLQYIDHFKTAEISNLLKSIDFSSIVRYYDYEKMLNLVYKLAKPEKLSHLEAEFNNLKIFFNEAVKLDAFVVVKVN